MLVEIRVLISLRMRLAELDLQCCCYNVSKDGIIVASQCVTANYIETDSENSHAS